MADMSLLQVCLDKTGAENCFLPAKLHLFNCCVELNLKICGIRLYSRTNDAHVSHTTKFAGTGDITLIGQILI